MLRKIHERVCFTRLCVPVALLFALRFAPLSPCMSVARNAYIMQFGNLLGPLVLRACILRRRLCLVVSQCERRALSQVELSAWCVRIKRKSRRWISYACRNAVRQLPGLLGNWSENRSRMALWKRSIGQVTEAKSFDFCSIWTLALFEVIELCIISLDVSSLRWLLHYCIRYCL
jgi:hypothetical protein